MRGSREISLVPSLHRASTDALIEIGQFSFYPELYRFSTSCLTFILVIVSASNKGWRVHLYKR